jgi:hypothetical protein
MELPHRVNVSRANLVRTLKAMHAFDSMGSPFVGMETLPDTLGFRRTSALGLIETVGYERSRTPLIVSLAHLREVLAVMNSEEVSLDRDPHGICRVSSVGVPLPSEIRVHTARNDTPWAQPHVPGDAQAELPPDLFAKIHVASFPLVAQPILQHGKLMLPTAEGVVIREQMPAVQGSYPRKAFIQALGGEAATRIYTTDRGYWGATIHGLHILVAGHRQGDPIFLLYKDAATTLAELPAGQVLYALRAASLLAGDKSRIVIDPKTGIQVKDQFGNPAIFSLGPLTGFAAFHISVSTGKVLTEALGQNVEETMTLASLHPDTYRLSRGPWSVSFKIQF